MATLVAASATFPGSGSAQAQAPSRQGPALRAVVGVRLFDGEGVVPKATVVWKGAKILAVGPGVEVPDDCKIFDGKGKTLLPGLIDAHTHFFEGALERALRFGVTTELDMFSVPESAAELRRQQEKGAAHHRADLFSAGILVTAPGGHGTQFGLRIPTLASPEEAPSFLRERVAEGSDYIKLVLEDGSDYGRKVPTLGPRTFAAAVRATHELGKLAVVHVNTRAAARQALAAGADGLAHLFTDYVVDQPFVQRARNHGLFVVPTLTVLESVWVTPSGASLVTDPRLAPYLTGTEKRALAHASPLGGRTLEAAYASVRALHEAGVTLLAGSDAPNPGTTHGASLHRELELLVEAGLRPTEALAAATSAPAAAFGLEDRGRIVAGRRADLLLVRGDPTTNILATRAIAMVWKGGRPVDRRKTAEPLSPPQREQRSAAGWLISDFESGEGLKSDLGFGWRISTDTIRGGDSAVTMEPIAGGPPGSRGAMAIQGEIRRGSTHTWAGPKIFLGKNPTSPLNLSGTQELVFWARGDGGTYRVLVFTKKRGQFKAWVTFQPKERWAEYILPWRTFEGIDTSDITAILFSAGPDIGPFWFDLDQLSFR